MTYRVTYYDVVEGRVGRDFADFPDVQSLTEHYEEWDCRVLDVAGADVAGADDDAQAPSPAPPSTRWPSSTQGAP